MWPRKLYTKNRPKNKDLRRFFLCYTVYMNIKSFQKIALALSIIVVLNLVFNLGINTFYNGPDVDNFCGEETRQIYTTQNSCEATGGEWIETFPKEPRFAPRIEGELRFEPYCNAQAECRGEYQDARSLYNRNVFIFLVILGLISMGAGFVTTAVKAVSTGFLFGGLLSLIIASMRYWSDMNEFLRFATLIVTLVGLIWLGYKKLKDKDWLAS